MIHFISDTHFGHANVIKYSNRPFDDVHQMDYTMITNICEAVKPGDVLYHLGDFGMHKAAELERILAVLPKMHLLLGNHDSEIRKKKRLHELFLSVNDFLEIKVPDVEAHQRIQRITLCHYALRVWNHSHHGAWSLYGHSHGGLEDPDHLLSTDVGVDATKAYGPVSYDWVKAKMAAKRWMPVDHHGVTEEDGGTQGGA